MPAGTRTDSVSVYFRKGQSLFEPAFDNNGAAMNAFIERLRLTMSSVDSIVVSGYVSPEGHDIHDPLSRNRCNQVAKYIIRQTGINPGIVKIDAVGVDWDLLRQYVAGTPDVPSRQKILEVIDNVPVWIYDAKGKIVDGRNKRLMEISGGRPYRWMLANLFPKLRKTVGVAVYATAPEPDVCPEPVVRSEETDIRIDVGNLVYIDSIDSIAPPL